MSQRARRKAAPKCPRGWHRDTLGRHPSRHGRAPHALAAAQLANFTATTSEGIRRGIQLALGCCEGFVRRTPVLLPEQVQRLFQLALAEFASDWEIAGVRTELSLHKPEHWASGLGTFGLVLRNRMTGGAKGLGWRTGEPSDAAHYPGISCRILEAYAGPIMDPLPRYFEEIGLVPASASPLP